MTDTPAIAERLRTMSPVEIPDRYADGVVEWLDILATHIAIFGAIELPDTIEPAPVFRT